MKKTLLVLLFAFISNYTFSQSKDLKYQPRPNSTLEETFPIITYLLVNSYKISLVEFDYGKQYLKSTPYEYYRGISKHKGSIEASIDENGILDIKVVDVYFYDSQRKSWFRTSDGLIFKKEQEISASLMQILNKVIDESQVLHEYKDWFFKDLYVSYLFFQNATELAAERWFDTYLKNQKITWNINFRDIQKNTFDDNYKYVEFYDVVLLNKLSSKEILPKFFITKYTNSDENVLKSKGSQVNLEGYIRELKYESGLFRAVVTQNQDDPITINTLQAEITTSSESSPKVSLAEKADQLKKIKELLDLEVITKEEFEAEKAKILNQE